MYLVVMFYDAKTTLYSHLRVHLSAGYCTMHCAVLNKSQPHLTTAQNVDTEDNNTV